MSAPIDDTEVALPSYAETIPGEVALEVATVKHGLLRVGMRYLTVAMLSWLLFFPVIWLAGLRRLDYVLLIAAGVTLTSGIAWMASRRAEVGLRSQVALLVALVLANLTLTRQFGPLILVPTIVVTWTIVFQAHPVAATRQLATALGVVTLVLPPILELAGVIPASYAFEHGTLTVLPQMTDLPRGVVTSFLLVAHVAMALMPAAFIRRLRDGLERVQTHHMVQTWHFRRLGDDLRQAAAPRR